MSKTSKTKRSARCAPAQACFKVVGYRRRERDALLRTTALQAAVMTILATPLLAQPAPNAHPTGGQVVGGQIAIGQNGNTTTITQSSQRGAINWQNFDVGSNETVQFIQPNAQSATLNTVLSNNPSLIAGRITANGQVFLVNQSGVVFFRGSQVETAGLSVSAAGITTQNFMAGKMIFDQAPHPGALISNAGNITITQAGLASLVAPQVRNSGVITARLGRVILGGATTYQLDLYGDGLLALNVTGLVGQVELGGQNVTALVTNTGVILADGGTVVLSAAAVDGLLRNLVMAGGSISAQTVGATPGRILVQGVGGGVDIEGDVAATGVAAGSVGGTVVANATGAVTVGATGVLDASGDGGGGLVAVGTTAARAAGGSGVQSTLTAQSVMIAPGGVVRANAGTRGNGGRIAVIGSVSLTHEGRIEARGGASSGNGGYVELSTPGSLVFDGGTVDAGAPRGQGGYVRADGNDVFLNGHLDNGSGTCDPNCSQSAPYWEIDAGHNIYVNYISPSTPTGGVTDLSAINAASIAGLILDAGNAIDISGSLYVTTDAQHRSANLLPLELIAGLGGINLTAFNGTPALVEASAVYVSAAGGALAASEGSFAIVDASGTPGTFGIISTSFFFPPLNSSNPPSAPTSIELTGLNNAFGTLSSVANSNPLSFSLVNVDDTAALDVTANIVSAGTLAIAVTAGTLDINAGLAGTSVYLAADGALQLNANLSTSAAGTVSLTSTTSDITENSAAAIDTSTLTASAGNGIELAAGSNSFSTLGPVTADTYTNGPQNGAIDIFDTTSLTTVGTITTGTNGPANGTVTLEVTAGGNLDITGGITGTSLYLTADGSLQINAGISSASTGTVSLTSNLGDITEGSTASIDAGTLTSAAGNGITLTSASNSFSMLGAVTADISANGTNTPNGSIIITDDTGLTTTGTISTSSNGTAYGNVTLNVTSGTLDIAGGLTGASVNLAADGALQLNADISTSPGGTVALISNTGDITQAANVAINAGTLTASAGRGITLTAARNAVSALGAVTADTDTNGPLNGAIDINDSVALTTTGTITTSNNGTVALDVTNGAGLDITGGITGTSLYLAADGALQINADLTAEAAGTVSLISNLAGISEGSNFHIDTGTLTASAGTGITLASTANAFQAIGNITASGGSITLDDSYQGVVTLSAGSVISTPGSYGIAITLNGSDGSLNLLGTLQTGTGSSYAGSVSLAAGGNIAEAGNGVILTGGLAANAGGNVGLLNTANIIGALDASSAGAVFALADSIPLNVAGAVTAGVANSVAGTIILEAPQFILGQTLTAYNSAATSHDGLIAFDLTPGAGGVFAFGATTLTINGIPTPFDTLDPSYITNGYIKADQLYLGWHGAGQTSNTEALYLDAPLIGAEFALTAHTNGTLGLFTTQAGPIVGQIATGVFETDGMNDAGAISVDMLTGDAFAAVLTNASNAIGTIGNFTVYGPSSAGGAAFSLSDDISNLVISGTLADQGTLVGNRLVGGAIDLSNNGGGITVQGAITNDAQNLAGAPAISLQSTNTSLAGDIAQTAGSLIDAASGDITLATALGDITQTGAAIMANDGGVLLVSAGNITQSGNATIFGTGAVQILLDGAAGTGTLTQSGTNALIQSAGGSNSLVEIHSLNGPLDLGGGVWAGGTTTGTFSTADAGTVLLLADTGIITETGSLKALALAVYASGDIGLDAPGSSNQVGQLLTAAQTIIASYDRQTGTSGTTTFSTGAGGNLTFVDDAQGYNDTLLIEGGTITVGSGATLTVTGTLSQNANTLTATNGNVVATASGDIDQTSSQILASGDANVTAGFDVIQQASSITAQDNASVTATNSIQQTNSRIEATAGIVTLVAHASTGTLGIEQTNSIITADNNAVSITAEGALLQNGGCTIYGLGNVTILLDGATAANGQLSQTSTDLIQSAGATPGAGFLTIRSLKGDLDLAGTLMAGVPNTGTATFNVASAGTVLLLADSGSITESANEGVSFTGAIQTRALAAEAGGDVLLETAVSNTNHNQIGQLLTTADGALIPGAMTPVATAAGGLFWLLDDATGFAIAGHDNALLLGDGSNSGGRITAGTGFTLTVTGTISQNNSTLTATSGDIALATPGGDIMQNNGAIVASNGNITLIAGTPGTDAGSISQSSSTMSATGAMGGTITATAATDIVQQSSLIYALDDVNAAGDNSVSQTGSTIDSGGAVNIFAGTRGLAQIGSTIIGETGTVYIDTTGGLSQAGAAGSLSNIIGQGDVAIVLANGLTQSSYSLIQSGRGTVGLYSAGGDIDIAGVVMAGGTFAAVHAAAGTVGGTSFNPSAAGTVLLLAQGGGISESIDGTNFTGAIYAQALAAQAGAYGMAQAGADVLLATSNTANIHNEIGQLLTNADNAQVADAISFGTITSTTRAATSSGGSLVLNDVATGFNGANIVLLNGTKAGGVITVATGAALSVVGTISQNSSTLLAASGDIMLATPSGDIIQDNGQIIATDGNITLAAGTPGADPGSISQISSTLSATGTLGGTISATAATGIAQQASLMYALDYIDVTGDMSVAQTGSTIDSGGAVNIFAGTLGLAQAGSTIVGQTSTVYIDATGGLTQQGTSNIIGAGDVAILLANGLTQTASDLIQSAAGTIGIHSTGGTIDIAGLVMAGGAFTAVQAAAGTTGGTGFNPSSAGTVLLRADHGLITEARAGGGFTGAIQAKALAAQAGAYGTAASGDDVLLQTANSAKAHNEIAQLLTNGDNAQIVDAITNGTLTGSASVATSSGGSLFLTDDTTAFAGHTLMLGDSGTITAGSGATFAVIGTISQSNSTLTAASGNIALTAMNGVGFNGNVEQTNATIAAAQGSIAIAADTAIDQASSSILARAGDITLTAKNGSIAQSLASSIAADAGSIILLAAGNITQSSSTIKAGTGIELTATTGNITQVAGTITSTHGDVDCTAGGSIDQSGSTLAASSGNVTLTASAGDIVQDNSTISANGGVTVTARGSIAQSGSKLTATLGSVALTATSGDITQDGSMISAGDAITGTAGGNITQANISTITADAGAIILVAAHSISQSNAVISAGGSITLTATAGNIDQAGGTIEALAGDLIATAGASLDQTSSTLKASGNISLTANTGSITQNAGSMIGAATGAITLTAKAGNITQDAASIVEACASESACGTSTGITLTANTGPTAVAGIGNITLNGTMTAQSILIDAALGTLTLGGGTMTTFGTPANLDPKNPNFARNVKNTGNWPVAFNSQMVPSMTGAGIGMLVGQLNATQGETFGSRSGRPGAVEIIATGRAGKLKFGGNAATGLNATNDLLLLDLNGGTAQGYIDVAGLAVVTRPSNSGSSTLSGIVEKFYGPTAASVSFTTGEPQQNIQINNCPLSSTNCILLSPFAPPIYSLINEFTPPDFVRRDDDQNFDLPNVAQEDY